MALARESTRQHRASVAAARQMERERATKLRLAERAAIIEQRERSRGIKQLERQTKEQYVKIRLHETDDLNFKVTERLRELDDIFHWTLLKDATVKFASLRVNVDAPKNAIPSSLYICEPKPHETQFMNQVHKPRGLAALWPGANKRYEKEIKEARAHFAQALDEWASRELRRLQELTNAELDHRKELEAHEQKKSERNHEVDAFEAEYRSGDPTAVVSYNTLVLENSIYPEGFPQNFSIAYTLASKQIVIEYELPSVSIVPSVVEFKYVKSSDDINKRERKASDIRTVYQDVVASVTLRTIHEIFEADQGNHVDVVCFNGFIHTIDPATGQDIQPHLVSVRVTKNRFRELDLSRIDKAVCLKNLGAQVSRQPDEAVPIKPIVEFDMADARFIDQTDLVSGLSSATNLMDLNPYEFEQLVANLFSGMGLDSRLTRSHRDGGVDCIAYDRRPVLGGKVVIQAKRYRHTVGVSAVRDLYGTMMNEGANKGILVTTSGYGPDAFDFAKDKPIELIDGGGLLFLLQEIGMQARIIIPADN
jgi:restriction system protein